MLANSAPPDDVRGAIHRVYQALATAPSLAPSAAIDRLFSELVELARAASPEVAKRALEDPIVDAISGNLRRICSTGETLLESHWAARVLASTEDPWEALARFPYFRNYELLCRLEVGGLEAVGAARPATALFIGSGPLPLSSILLARDFGVVVTNVDADLDACRAGARLAARLGQGGVLRFAHADARALGDLAGYDAVFLAALVGLGPREKERVIEHVAARVDPGTLLVLRSAERLRTLLYPRVELARVAAIEPLVELHPHHEVINSVVVARRRR